MTYTLAQEVLSQLLHMREYVIVALTLSCTGACMHCVISRQLAGMVMNYTELLLITVNVGSCN
jgi:hypothetical protein